MTSVATSAWQRDGLLLLPEMLSEDATRELVQKVCAEHGLTSKKQLGMVMKNVLATHKGRVDGKLVQRLASEILE